MRILVTAFDPFGGETCNPAEAVLSLLPGMVGGAAIIPLVVPTAFGRSLEMVIQAIRTYHPDAVVCLGQAGGRSGITVEHAAINWMDAAIQDNLGQQPVDERINASGPEAYFATLPVRAMVSAMRDAGLPAGISLSAGAFVCNYLMYGVLHYLRKEDLGVKAGFIHLPFLPVQAEGRKGIPSMPLEDMVRGIVLGITALLAQTAAGRDG